MIEAMRAAVLANPDDVTLRQVLIDALLEVGDPMGEIMRASASDEFPHLGRPDELVLAGRLRPALHDFSVYRAALVAVTLKRLTPREYRRITGRPEWASVRSIHFGRGTYAPTQTLPVQEVATLVTHPVMTSLRELTGFDLEVLREIGTRPPALHLETLHVRCNEAHHFPREPLTSLTHVTRMTLENCQFEHFIGLVNSPLMSQLRVLELNLRFEDVAEFLLAPLSTDSSLEMFRVGSWQGVREKAGWHLHIEAAGNSFLSLGSLLPAVGPSIHRLTIATQPLSDELRRETCDLAATHGWELHLEETLRGPELVRLADDDAPF